jgi:hypothetical protein
LLLGDLIIRDLVIRDLVIRDLTIRDLIIRDLAIRSKLRLRLRALDCSMAVDFGVATHGRLVVGLGFGLIYRVVILLRGLCMPFSLVAVEK